MMINITPSLKILTDRWQWIVAKKTDDTAAADPAIMDDDEAAAPEPGWNHSLFFSDLPSLIRALQRLDCPPSAIAAFRQMQERHDALLKMLAITAADAQIPAGSNVELDSETWLRTPIGRRTDQYRLEHSSRKPISHHNTLEEALGAYLRRSGLLTTGQGTPEEMTAAYQSTMSRAATVASNALRGAA